jgi:hypothetical protein
VRNCKRECKCCLGYYELKQHKLRFDLECWNLLGYRKQVKLLWLQKQRNGDNLKLIVLTGMKGGNI